MENKILHGDSLDLLKDMSDNSVDMILTDLPYFGVVDDDWDNQWETFAHTPDGKYLMPITWAREVYKTKKEAKRQIEKLAKKWNWKQKEKK